jgi:hypothetical protein
MTRNSAAPSFEIAPRVDACWLCLSAVPLASSAARLFLWLLQRHVAAVRGTVGLFVLPPCTRG